jgi:hypothetical protein
VGNAPRGSIAQGGSMVDALEKKTRAAANLANESVFNGKINSPN